MDRAMGMHASGAMRAVGLAAGIAWAAACPAVQRQILYVVGSPALSASDAALYALMTNAGYAVTLLDDNDSSPAAATNKAGVVISQSVSSPLVGTNFTRVAVPVLVCEPNIYDDMGMTGGTGFGGQAGQVAIRIVPPATHALCAGLTGTVAVYTAAQSLNWGQPNSNAFHLATLTNDAGREVIFAYDAGAAMVAGTAPARRVGLFVTEAGATSLTAQGRALFAAGLQWTAGVSTSNPPPRERLGPCTRDTGVAISEIMYKPANRPDLLVGEFVEFYNSDPVPVDLSRWRLGGDVDFVFPDGYSLPAYGFCVIARDPAAMATIHGITNALGPYTNVLDGRSGQVRLYGRWDQRLLEVNYDSEPPWPAAPRAGHSLVLSRPSYGEDDPRAWGASRFLGGSPGRDDPWTNRAFDAVVVNEVLAHTDLPQLDYVELFNAGTQAVNLGTCLLTDGSPTNVFMIPTGTVLLAGAHLAFTETQMGFKFDPSGGDVFLVNTAQSFVVDGLVFGANRNGIPIGRYPDGSPRVRDLASATAGAANAPPRAAEIVINELMYNPLSGLVDDEYVELHNPGAQAVDLSNWRLTKGVQFTFPAGASIPAGGYAVVGRNRARLLSFYPGLDAAVTFGDYSGQLANGGERVRLAKPDDPLLPLQDFVTVDEVTYVDGGRWPSWPDGGGSSLELIDPRADNLLAPNWAGSDEAAGAPWTTVEHTGVLDLGTNVPIDEVQVFLLGEGECLLDNVEVAYNGANLVPNGTFESGTNGWIIQGNHIQSRREAAGGDGGGACLRLVTTGDGDNGANRAEIDLSSALSAGVTATIRARVRWLKGSPWIVLRLRGNWLECAGPLTAPAAPGTPGAPNRSRAANAGPAIAEAAHFPLSPGTGEPAVVTARIDDPDGVAWARLHYRLDPATNETVLDLNDRGTGADERAGDGLYSGYIPAQPTNTLIAFHVEAADGHASPRTNRFPATAPSREALVRTGDKPLPGAFGTLHAILTATNIHEWTTRQRMSNEQLDSTLVCDDRRAIYNAGIRYRGSSFLRTSYTSPTGALCAYALDIPPDNPYLGATSLNLDTQEPTRDSSNQREKIAFWMAESLGVPHPHLRFVGMHINGLRRSDFYTDTHQPNFSFLDTWFPDEADGELFEIDDWFEFNDNPQVDDERQVNATLERFPTTGGILKLARYRWSWQKKNHGWGANDYSNFFGLVETMNEPVATAYVRRVKAAVDTENWIREVGLRHICTDYDGYGFNRGKNTFLYLPAGGEWHLLLWDMDFSFGAWGSGNGVTNRPYFGDFNDPVFSSFISRPEFTRAYWRVAQEAVNGCLRPERVGPYAWSNYYALVNSGATADTPASVLAWIDGRRAYLQGELARLETNFAVTTSNGVDFATTNAAVVLEGRAPLEVEKIRVNGQPATIEWTAVQTWRHTQPLAPGANPVVYQGLAYDGSAWPGAADTIVVTRITGDLPMLGNIRFTELHYHPLPVGTNDGENYEIVELKNCSTGTVDLSGGRLDDGIHFTFPVGTRLSAGAFLVLASSGKYTNAFPWVPVFGTYTGQLSNGGEAVTLYDAANQLVGRVAYDDVAPWPLAPDGGGCSLAPTGACPSGSQDTAAAWRASTLLGGSPGYDDPEPVPTPPAILAQPADMFAPTGTLARFYCPATGYPEVGYRWTRDDAAISGATNLTLTWGPVTYADAGSLFACIVSNAAGCVTSRAAMLYPSGIAGPRQGGCPVAIYTFDEGSGTVVHDRSGLSPPMDLVFQGGGIAWRTGGAGVVLSSPSVLVTTGAAARISSAIRASGACTFEVWCIPSASNAASTRVSCLGSGNSSVDYGLYALGTNWQARVRTTATTWAGTPGVNAPGAVPYVMKHLATVFTGGVLSIYVNGSLAGSTNLGGTLDSWVDTFAFSLGAFPDGSYAWIGEFRYAAIHSCALTPADIQANYLAGPTYAPGPAAPSVGVRFSAAAPPALELFWSGETTAVYRLQSAGLLGAGSWTNAGPALEGSVGEQSVTNLLEGSEPYHRLLMFPK